MKDDNEQILAEFHEQARGAFFELFADFDQAAQALHREKEEQQFQKTRHAFGLALKARLEALASGLLQAHQHNRQENDLSQNLQRHIQYYLHQFVVKTRER
ncbi:hypothetical protein EPD60_16580 [Flaviaesturariibacter flavus]|uniref:Uncharacterized protein n=1 Tax=Flaviaesturariibacter flavus TaxID=2502780 RepID=A0A4R1B284_9BACT|nr:hypothetical protein [Flaviaesturariibacter flavus]TCJ12162.1 hypothetical protein EPD60_16580 [Flaviaesturariibacter flavus]